MFSVLRLVSPFDVPSEGWLPARNEMSLCSGWNLDLGLIEVWPTDTQQPGDYGAINLIRDPP